MLHYNLQCKGLKSSATKMFYIVLVESTSKCDSDSKSKFQCQI
jgi:hypothetical protein